MLLISSCGTTTRIVERKVKTKPAKEFFKRKSDKIMACVNHLIKVDVKPLEAKEICLAIYQ